MWTYDFSESLALAYWSVTYMPEKRRARQQKVQQLQRQRRLTIIKWAVFGLMALYLVVQGYNLAVLYQEKAHVEQQLQELQQRNEELEKEKASLQDPSNIEKVARDELGLVKPGEVPYVK